MSFDAEAVDELEERAPDFSLGVLGVAMADTGQGGLSYGVTELRSDTSATRWTNTAVQHELNRRGRGRSVGGRHVVTMIA
jgi:hypothetical protein